jgi:hypothetical protein
MKASSVAGLTSMLVLCGCAGAGRLFVGGPVAVEHLEGNYERLAACTYRQLGRHHDQLLLSDQRERRAVKVASTRSSGAHWELSFINEDGGRQTRLEVASADDSLPGEHVLALARACAA